jgi:Secretion system C-terminal sorting domain
VNSRILFPIFGTTLLLKKNSRIVNGYAIQILTAPDAIAMKTTHIILTLLLIANLGLSQTTFQKTIGGINDDLGNAVQETSDGGYIVAGETRSYGAGSRDVYLVKLDSLGGTDWSKTYGGNLEDYALTLDQTTDGGFMVGAHTASFGQGGHDHYLIKTDGNGDTLFTKLYGGSAPDGIYQLKQGAGGIVLAGHTSSFGAGAHDFYVIKILESGDTVWTKTFGGSGPDQLRGFANIEEFVDIPRLAFIGETNGFGAGSKDILLIKADMNGTFEFARTYGNTGNDHGFSVLETPGGGLLIAGHTNSSGAGSYDVYLIKVDFSGDVEWARTYGGSGDDYCYFAQRTQDGGFILTGSTNSFGGGKNDVYVIKTNALGDTMWTKTYGGSMDEVGQSVQQTGDGGYIFTGSTTSFGSGLKDIYVIKTDANGYSGGCNEFYTNTLTDDAATIATSPVIEIHSGSIPGSSTTIVNNATSSNSVACDTLVGINSFAGIGHQVKVFPNPFSESAVVEFNYKSGNYSFLLYSPTGQLVRKIEKINSNRIQVEKNNLTEGMYFFQLKNTFEIIASGKLIIE